MNTEKLEKKNKLITIPKDVFVHLNRCFCSFKCS